ncbi:MAG: hypothetical protein H0W06_06150 [Chloroflexia bacterium]|nr:hypothetical protein [Chloroflexia bacterium]
MPREIALERFTQELVDLLDETFEQVRGIYLDRNTSLFETLTTISADEASRPVSDTCASIAAQVKHVRVYLEVIDRALQGHDVGKIDWAASWRIEHVTLAEWESLKEQLRAAHQDVLATMTRAETWDDEDSIGDALAALVHTAYHLGEIRQALCVVKR